MVGGRYSRELKDRSRKLQETAAAAAAADDDDDGSRDNGVRNTRCQGTAGRMLRGCS
jgi:hypothetical protein